MVSMLIAVAIVAQAGPKTAPKKSPKSNRKETELKSGDRWKIVSGPPVHHVFESPSTIFRAIDVDNGVDFLCWFSPKAPTAVFVGLQAKPPSKADYRPDDRFRIGTDTESLNIGTDPTVYSPERPVRFELIVVESTAVRLADFSKSNTLAATVNSVKYKLTPAQIAGLREFATIVQETAKKGKR